MDRLAATPSDWLGIDPGAIGLVALSAVGIYLAVIFAVRIAGPRSFSQMSAFDFATTVAVGTIVASTALSSEVSLFEGLAAVATLLAAQSLIGVLRRRYGFGALVDNSPVVLIRDGVIYEGNLERVRMTSEDMAAKLREAGVLTPARVRLAVMETTGRVTVIEGGNEDRLDPLLLEGVTGFEQDQRG